MIIGLLHPQRERAWGNTPLRPCEPDIIRQSNLITTQKQVKELIMGRLLHSDTLSHPSVRNDTKKQGVSLTVIASKRSNVFANVGFCTLSSAYM